MAIIAKSEGNFQQLAPGAYAARFVGLIDIGTQHGEYQGAPTINRQVIIQWEVPSEVIKDGDRAGEPMGISGWYTLSVGEKANLGRLLVGIRGRPFTEKEQEGFDITNVLGVPCMLTVVHNEKGKAKVQAAARLPKGMTIADQINDTVNFSLDEYLAGDTSHWDSVPDGIKPFIEKSDEWKEAGSTTDSFPEQGGEDPFAEMAPDFGDVPVSDDIPF